MNTRAREPRSFWQTYSILTTAVLAGFLLSATFHGKPTFEEIDVERINIVEADGTLRMVISNEARQHPGIVDGEVIERSGPRPPGMIFFNHLGDEMGGLVFGPNGGNGHFGQFSFDKVRGDQTIGFRHLEGNNGKYRSGIEMWQQPNIPSPKMLAQIDAARAIEDPSEREAAFQQLTDNDQLTQRRLFLGKGRDDTSMLALYDIKGRPRARLAVDAHGVASLEFLDADGAVVQRIPE